MVRIFHHQNKYETRSELEVRREDCVRLLSFSLALLVIWFLLAIVSFCFTRETTPVLYWICRILKFIAKWGGIIFMVLFIAYEIYTLVLWHEEEHPKPAPDPDDYDDADIEDADYDDDDIDDD